MRSDQGGQGRHTTVAVQQQAHDETAEKHTPASRVMNGDEGVTLHEGEGIVLQTCEVEKLVCHLRVTASHHRK